MLPPIQLYTIISRLTRAGHFLITTLPPGWGKAWESHHFLHTMSLPEGPKAIPPGGSLLNSHFTVDGDQTSSCLHPHCPVKLWWKSLLVKTLHHQPAAARTVPHVLPAQRGESKNAGQEGQDAEMQDRWVQKTFYRSWSKEDHSWGPGL